MRVDLAICTFGRGDTVLTTLKKSSTELGAFGTVMIIDNNPQGLPESALTALNEWRVQVIHEPAVGLSRARNRALSESTAEYVWFIDDDASLCTGFGAKAKEYLQKFSNTPEETRPVFGGGFIIAASDTGTASNIGRFELGLLSCMNTNEPFAQPWGANMFVDRALALQVGGFDPRLGWVKETGALLGEEDDLFLRMCAQVPPARGKAFFTEGCSVHHWIPEARRKLSWLIPRAVKGGRSNFIVYKHAPVREGIDAVKKVLKAPTKDNLLYASFIGGKLLQRCNRT